ncbi:Appr-1-p processing protein [bacterium]|nr:MAG: Appr-1-p processing protein [bacterium]
MKIYLTSVEPELAKAWRQFCGDLDFVTVHEGSIFDLECDAVVSPANSFCFMDGGIDLLYSKRFGWQVQERLQELILNEHHGELLVGAAEIVETEAAIPYLIAAPTMRVPMILRDTINPYLAARAAVLLVQHGVFRAGKLQGTRVSEVVQSVAFPGLGTGVGQVGGAVCAHQVRTAIDDVLLNVRPFPVNWVEAQARHQLLYTDRVRNLQHSEY